MKNVKITELKVGGVIGCDVLDEPMSEEREVIVVAVCAAPKAVADRYDPKMGGWTRTFSASFDRAYIVEDPADIRTIDALLARRHEDVLARMDEVAGRARLPLGDEQPDVGDTAAL